MPLFNNNDFMVLIKEMLSLINLKNAPNISLPTISDTKKYNQNITDFINNTSMCSNL